MRKILSDVLVKARHVPVRFSVSDSFAVYRRPEYPRNPIQKYDENDIFYTVIDSVSR